MVQYATVFLWKCVNLMTIFEFDKLILVIDASHCFIRILTATFLHPPLFWFTAMCLILLTKTRKISGVVH